MELNVLVGDGTDHQATNSLYRWLCRDDDLGRGDSQITRANPIPPGGLGGLEMINVVLSNSIALGALIVAVAGWRASRPRGPVVRLRHNGVFIDIEGTPAEIRRIVDALTPAEPPASEPDAAAGSPADAEPDPGHGREGDRGAAS